NVLDHSRCDSFTMTGIRAWRWQNKVPLHTEAEARKSLSQAGIAQLRMVGNQDDVAAGKLPAGKPFREQVFHDASMHNQRDKAKHGKEHAGAAGEFTSDF